MIGDLICYYISYKPLFKLLLLLPKNTQNPFALKSNLIISYFLSFSALIIAESCQINNNNNNNNKYNKMEVLNYIYIYIF